MKAPSPNHRQACIHAQSCPVLHDPRDCSPPGSSVHGIFLTRILEQVAISSSRGCSQPRDLTHASCVSCIDRRTLYHWVTWEGPLTTGPPGSSPPMCLLLSLSWIDRAWNKLWKLANFWSKHRSKEKTFKRVCHVQMLLLFDSELFSCLRFLFRIFCFFHQSLPSSVHKIWNWRRGFFGQFHVVRTGYR